MSVTGVILALSYKSGEKDKRRTDGMIYLRLFTAFMKIGFTSFGGMSMIPVIMQEMKVNHWMTAEDLT